MAGAAAGQVVMSTSAGRSSAHLCAGSGANASVFAASWP